jgi:ABC-2 type transport system permease protein
MSVTSATSYSAADTGQPVGGRKAGFGHYMLAEWTKIRSVRSTLWTLIIAVIVIVGFTALISWVVVANWHGPHAAARDARAISDPTSIIYGVGIYLGQLAIAVLGVLVVTTEYSTGVIRASLLAVPRRYTMLAAKVVVFTLVMLVLAEVIAFGSFFVGAAVMHSHVSVSLSGHDVLRATFGAGLYLVAFGLFALALGVLIRHTAGAISVAVAVAFVLPILTGLLPDTSFFNHLNAYLPEQAGSQIYLVRPEGVPLLSAWQGLGVLCIYVVVLLGIGAYLFDRRDA